jgi:hypothetical protein
MTTNTVLTAAHNQWASRPADQRFSSLEALHSAVTHHREVATEATSVDLSQLRVGMDEVEPVLISPTGNTARFTNAAFRQLCTKARIPAQYMTQLPAELMQANMNHGLSAMESNDNAALLFARNGSLRLRAVTSMDYQRIWNSDITSRLMALTAQQPEWTPAPAAFDGSRGLYASDSDMFAFMVDNERRIFERGPEGGLSRGFFVSNSETGNGAFSITTFFYEFVCGNHRVWGASNVQNMRIRHVGRADERAFEQLAIELTKYANASASTDERVVEVARTMVLADTKDALLDRVFGLRLPDVSRRTLNTAYEVAEAHEDWYGNPRSVWGYVGGLTQVARDLPNASDRVALEGASSRLMNMAVAAAGR